MRTNSPWASTREPLGRREGESVEANLLSRIGGAAPFFALKGLIFDGTELRARAESVTDPGSELGPASAAEIARHALVAGSGCLALGRPDGSRCYYLASSIDGTFFASSASFGTVLEYSAIPTAQGPVGGAAQIEARHERELVARLRVSYAVVEEGLFARLFVARRTATFGDTGSYQDYQPFSSVATDANAADARVLLETSACRGHFHQHPALPPSTLLGQLVRLGATLTPGRFRVSAIRMRSQAVAWAGDELSLRVTRSPGLWHLTGRATVAGRGVASLDFSLTPPAGRERGG
jgi:hypothetical protein